MPRDPLDIFDCSAIRGDWMTHRDVRHLKHLWRSAFVPHHDETSRGLYGKHDWNIFSRGLSKCAATGTAAIARYERQSPMHLIILIDDPFVGFRGDFERMPSPRNGYDVYVCDEKVSWTMVFTHEQDFGPYFTAANASA